MRGEEEEGGYDEAEGCEEERCENPKGYAGGDEGKAPDQRDGDGSDLAIVLLQL